MGVNFGIAGLLIVAGTSVLWKRKSITKMLGRYPFFAGSQMIVAAVSFWLLASGFFIIFEGLAHRNVSRMLLVGSSLIVGSIIGSVWLIRCHVSGRMTIKYNKGPWVELIRAKDPSEFYFNWFVSAVFVIAFLISGILLVVYKSGIEVHA